MCGDSFDEAIAFWECGAARVVVREDDDEPEKDDDEPEDDDEEDAGSSDVRERKKEGGCRSLPRDPDDDGAPSRTTGDTEDNEEDLLA